MNSCSIPVSIGELIDKITILKIKLDRIQNESALENIKFEYNSLIKLEKELDLSPEIFNLKNKLFDVNLELWEVCEQRRFLDKNDEFGESFINLSKLEYKLNDLRAKIKMNICSISLSLIREEKSYSHINNIKSLENESCDEFSIRFRKVVNHEIFGLINLNSVSNKKIDYFCKVIKSHSGNIIFCGVGKSGHIAKKLSSTFSSLGISSVFLHSTEALHGDLGVIKQNDCLIFISKSGEAEEFPEIYKFCRKNNISMLGISFNNKCPMFINKLID